MQVAAEGYGIVAERHDIEGDPTLREPEDDLVTQIDRQQPAAIATLAGGYVRGPAHGPSSGLRVAIVHEWLDTFAGSERVLEQLLLCFPSADIFAVVDFMGEEDRRFLQGRPVRTTFIQRLPSARRHFRRYLGLMPVAIQQLDLSGYELVFSSNHAVAKGVLTGPDQVHISYVHSPMRYAWDLQHQYLRQANIEHGLKGMYARWLLKRLREWDVSSAHQVDHFLANSSYIARRIAKSYRRGSTVIHPPVDVDRFVLHSGKDDFFLLAGRLVSYKRPEIVIESFADNPDRRLVVVGDGPESDRARRAARGSANIEFKGAVSQPVLIDLMQRARASIFAAEEDFGIAMVEAQACGTPVVAYGRGGATDIVVPPDKDQPTGMFFDRQDAATVSSAVERFVKLESRFSSQACRRNALRFSQSRFRCQIDDFVQQVFAECEWGSSWRGRSNPALPPAVPGMR
jgi:glycosyltransferase involved in cell wall biosynthesis